MTQPEEQLSPKERKRARREAKARRRGLMPGLTRAEPLEPHETSRRLGVRRSKGGAAEGTAANPTPKRYGGRYLAGFNGKSYAKPRVRKRKKR